MKPRRSPLGWIGAAAAAAVLALAFLRPAPPAGVSPTMIGGPFRLTDANGRTVTDRSFATQFKLIYFGYTSCAEICPTTLAHMQAALAALGPGSRRIQPLFITLDPQRDTPATLRRYTAAIAPSLIALTGPPQALRQIARSFHVWSADAPAGQIDHSAVLYLLAPDGRFIAPIRADLSSRDMAALLQRLVLPENREPQTPAPDL